MSDILKSIILGILEGITEFLPISSTGHLIIGTQLLNFRPDIRDTFEIFIQGGALVAVLLFYATEFYQQARHANDEKVQRWWLAIIIASLPTLVIGFLFASFIRDTLFRPLVVGFSLIAGGLLMYAAEAYHYRRAQQLALVPPVPTPSTGTAITASDEVTLSQALIVGLFQMFALIPGMSRSATSIIGGMFSGLSRPVATRFSFYLMIPVMGSATVYALIKDLSKGTSNELLIILIGTVVSGIVAWFAISWLLRYVARNSFVPFAIYRILVGVIILVLVAVGLLT